MFGICRKYFAVAVFFIGFINICASTVSVDTSASIYATAAFETDSASSTWTADSVDMSPVTSTSAATTTGISSTVSEPSGNVTSTMSTDASLAASTPTTPTPTASTASTSTAPTSTAPNSTTQTQIVPLGSSISLSTSVKATISPTPSRAVMESSSAIAPNPNAGASYKGCSSNQNDCKNNGKCYIGSDQSKLCFCGGDFYGEKCEKEANPLYKPLVYALGGATGFLLLVICIALLISCKKSKGYDTGASKDLDNFNNIGLRAKGVVNGSLIIE